ncbi:hypothetical protein SNEBB_010725 [Seison nebaliae]|nr:hypothetical protein SNEBB_010725 [Seison nebaliae]
MNWLSTNNITNLSNISNIAKNALNKAQKGIDAVLDINEEEQLKRLNDLEQTLKKENNLKKKEDLVKEEDFPISVPPSGSNITLLEEDLNNSISSSSSSLEDNEENERLSHIQQWITETVEYADQLEKLTETNEGDVISSTLKTIIDQIVMNDSIDSQTSSIDTIIEIKIDKEENDEKENMSNQESFVQTKSSSLEEIEILSCPSTIDDNGHQKNRQQNSSSNNSSDLPSDIVLLNDQNDKLKLLIHSMESQINEEKGKTTELEKININLMNIKRTLIEENEMCKQELFQKEELLKKLNEENNNLKILNNELRAEGESFSKQLHNHSLVTKKLRIKEKKQDEDINSLKEQIEKLQKSNETLQQKLNNNEQLLSADQLKYNRADQTINGLESELVAAKLTTNEANMKYETMKESLDKVNEELIDLKKNMTSLDKESKISFAEEHNRREMAENEMKIIRNDYEFLQNKMKQLQISLHENSKEHRKKDELHIKENENLLNQLRMLSNEFEESREKESIESRPFIQQMESMKRFYSRQLETIEKSETQMSERLIELQVKTISQEERMKSMKTSETFLKKCLEERNRIVDDLRKELEKVEEELKNLNSSSSNQIKCLKKEIEKMKKLYESTKENYENLRCDKIQLDVSHVSLESKYNQLLEDIQLKKNDIKIQRPSNDKQIDHSTLPSDNLPHQLYSMVRQTNGSSLSVIEQLQAKVQTLENNQSYLQNELTKSQEVNIVKEEKLKELFHSIDEYESKLLKQQELSKEYHMMQIRFNELLNMYGEMEEKNDELSMDLVEYKTMYKTQLEEYLKQKESRNI